MAFRVRRRDIEEYQVMEQLEQQLREKEHALQTKQNYFNSVKNECTEKVKAAQQRLSEL